MTIVVGLGNFGDKYAYTYHNLGYLAAECVADKLDMKFKKKACDCLIAEGNFCGDRLIIAKPLTYMNLSGTAVKQLMKKYGADAQDFVLLYDDIDIEKGKLRVRAEGSSGTHNGMRNIVEVTGRQDFPRVRIGMGPRPEYMDLADYVLSQIPSSERQMYYDLLADTAVQVLGLAEKRALKK